MSKKIPIEISARHIHLSPKDLEALFGNNYQLKKMRQLTQPSDFAVEEILDVQFGQKIISRIRIVGPIREKTQIELSMTDVIYLGITPIIKKSGDLESTSGITLIGPKNKIEIKEGVIIPWRHIHCSQEEAKELGLENGMMVSVKIEGNRALIFNNVLVRAADNYKLCMHLDTDEGNAAGIIKKGEGYLITNNQ